LVHQIGSAAGIQLAGVLRDITGSYDLPFAIAGSLLLPAALASFCLNEKKYSAKYQTVPAAPHPAAE
jgi:hypothetical protein